VALSPLYPQSADDRPGHHRVLEIYRRHRGRCCALSDR